MKNYYIKLAVNEVDEDILYKTRSVLNSDYPIRFYIYKPNGDICKYLTISSAKLHAKLISMGCYPNKSKTLKFPSFLDKNNETHFLRGLFDGDGSVGHNYNFNSVYASICGTFDICEGVRMLLERHNINSYVVPDKTAYDVRVSGKDNVYRFLVLLYDNTHEDIRMNRKYNKYCEIKDFYINNGYTMYKPQTNNLVPGNSMFGLDNPNSKFTPEDIKDILIRYQMGEKICSIHKDYMFVNRKTLSRVCNRKTWKEINISE